MPDTAYPGKGKVKFSDGMVKNADGDNIPTFQEAQTASSKCGCGPDCCNNVYHWRDQATDEHFVEYVLNGAKVLQLYSDFLANPPA